VPDNLWSPWRIDYILGEKEDFCIFCPEGEGLSDEERLILHRGRLSMVIMNKYPYTAGHLMVAPWRHVADFDELEDGEVREIMHWIRKSIVIVRRMMNPDGFNLGLNMGSAAGAGIEEHLHFHVVPRWNGDTNFMPAVADVRLIPEHIRQTYAKLLPHFERESAHDEVV
jgi:ATP adenylyltransferase